MRNYHRPTPAPAAVIVGSVLLTALVLALIAGTAILSWATAYYDDRVLTCRVNSLSTSGNTDNDGSSHYRVFTSCGPFSNEDSWPRGKWNSADVQAELVPGHTYAVEVVGPRITLLSHLPNIIDVIGEVQVPATPATP